MKHPVDLTVDFKWLANVLLNEPKPGSAFQMGDVFPVSSDQIIESDYLMSIADQTVAKM